MNSNPLSVRPSRLYCTVKIVRESGKLSKKHEWVLVYVIDEATTAIPTSILADINQILEDNHGCATKEERDAAMRRPEDFQDGEVLAYW